MIPISDMFDFVSEYRFPDIAAVPEPSCELAICALGNSRVAWEQRQMAKGQPEQKNELVIWTVNRGGHLWHHDLCFVLDDLKREFALDDAYRGMLNRYTDGVVVSHIYEDLEDFETPQYQYPLQEMVQWCLAHHVRPYFHNSIPMMIGLAVATGYKLISIHGADYTSPQGHTMEADRANVEYWIGVAETLGVEVAVPMSSTLINSNRPYWHVYGYDRAWEAKAAYDQAREIHASQAKSSPGEVMADDITHGSMEAKKARTVSARDTSDTAIAYQMATIRAAADQGNRIIHQGKDITEGILDRSVFLRGGDPVEIVDKPQANP